MVNKGFQRVRLTLSIFGGVSFLLVLIVVYRSFLLGIIGAVGGMCLIWFLAGGLYWITSRRMHYIDQNTEYLEKRLDELRADESEKIYQKNK